MDSDIVLCLLRLKFADCGVFDEDVPDVVCIDWTDGDLLLLKLNDESLSTIPEEVEDVEAKWSVPCFCWACIKKKGNCLMF
jgi:hypothetical protein